jgi:phosphonatase-like hydrolase
MIKMVVFDMAGTVLDENNVVYKTLHQAINEAGIPVTLDQVLLDGAGKEKLQAIKSILARYANTKDDKLSDRIYAQFIAQLGKAYETLEVFPQPNAEEIFRELKRRGILVILNTGYNAKTADTLLAKLHWKKGSDFDGLVTATDVQQNRPEPDMIQRAMEWFDISDPHQVVKVGDSIIDIEEGKNAGCSLNIGITTGAHSREQLESASPDYIIDNLLELQSILDEEEK